MIKGSLLQEDITIINIHAPNSKAPKCIRQTVTELKGEVHSNKIIEEKFNISLSIMDRTIRKKNQQRNSTLKQHYRSYSLNRSTQNIPPNSSRIHKSTWNILHGRSC